MFWIFDYIYFRINEYYLSITQDISDRIVGPAIVTIIEVFNLLTILLVLSFWFKQILSIIDLKHKPLLYIAITVIFAYNIYRYARVKDYEKLKATIGAEGFKSRKRNTQIIWIYVIISLGSLIYLGSIYK
jgi:hypothetical protein